MPVAEHDTELCFQNRIPSETVSFRVFLILAVIYFWLPISSFQQCFPTHTYTLRVSPIPIRATCPPHCKPFVLLPDVGICILFTEAVNNSVQSTGVKM